MNPNHYLAVAIDYLFGHRDGWPAERGGRQDAGQLVDDRPRRRRPGPAAARGAGRLQVVRPRAARRVASAFGGEESAGASFLRRDGSVWTTDKDGILLGLLARGDHRGDREDAVRALPRPDGALRRARLRPHRRPATAEQKAALAKLSPDAGHRRPACGRADHRRC